MRSWSLYSIASSSWFTGRGLAEGWVVALGRTVAVTTGRAVGRAVIAGCTIGATVALIAATAADFTGAASSLAEGAAVEVAPAAFSRAVVVPVPALVAPPVGGGS